MITREYCNACGGLLHDVFDMGDMPLANGLLAAKQLTDPPVTFPLLVAECQLCSLVQLRHVVDPGILYDDYHFYTGASGPNAAYFMRLANWIKNHTPGRRVLEIGSNDGTLLAALENRNFDVTGVDPAVEQCQHARKRLTRGRVMCDFWSSVVADKCGAAIFDAVVACNVLGHASDLGDFVNGIRRVLRPSGLFVIEVQYLKSLMRQAAFELIYHEHVSYFDEISLASLLVRNGFNVLGWETTDSQCGTLRMWASPSGTGIDIKPAQHDWPAFRSAVDLRREYLGNTIHEMISEERRVCFYGAPAKASQLANYCELTSKDIAFATDTTPAKQGMFIPGGIIPIVAPIELEPPDAAIVTAWNHWPYIRQQELAFVAAGGVLIDPTIEGLKTFNESVENESHARIGT